MTGPSAATRLTPREREIVRLIAVGLTNKEIAARLKISERTAGAHVQNMLNKLGVSNRAQIVAVASQEAPARGAPPTPAPSRPRGASRARLAALAAGAFAVTLILSADRQAGLGPTTPVTVTAGTTPAQISDPFDTGDVSSSTWQVVTGPHLRVVAESGHLAVYIGADAGNAFQAGLVSACRMRGDFDAQLSFRLVTWPRLNALWVSLMASGTPFNVYRASRDYTDTYGVYLPPGGGEVDATGDTGTLRLSRVGSTWSGYYMTSGAWTRIASGDGPVEDVGLNLFVFNGGIEPFGGREALVYFTGFRAAAGRFVCP